MKLLPSRLLSIAVVATLAGAGTAAAAQELNLYSSRHYQTDEALYEGFTEATGIRINRIEGKGDALLERIKSEGMNSPADIFLTVDVARLFRADQEDLFQAVDSKILTATVPTHLRHPQNHWFGFSTRARLIFYDTAKVMAGEIKSYEDLADPKWRGKVCIRKSSNTYNQSLLGSIVAAHGEAKAEAWAKGVVANFARDPVKGDTNQLRGIGTGECVVAVANSYYFVRLLTKPEARDAGLAEKIGVVFPNQDGRGTHVNISGAGMLKHAPNKAAAIKFLEYLTSTPAQRHFADGNNEYPVVAGIEANDALKSLGAFKVDPVNVAVFGENLATAQKIFDRAGWK